MASGSDLRVAYVAESTFGTTPATPTFDVLRTTSGGLSTTKQTVMSEEIRSDFNVVDELQVGQDVEGTYPFELTYASFDDMIEACLGGTWSTNVLKNGTTARYFTFEETIEFGATDSYRRFTGCMVNTMELNVAARERITGSFGIVGKQETLATAIVTGATYTAANTNQIMVAGTSVGTVSIGALSSPCIQSISLNVNRNLRRINCIDSIYANSMDYGMCDVTGEIAIYFEDNTAYQAVLDHGSAAISVTLGHTTNEKYTLEIPTARWLSGGVQIGGGNDDIIVQMPFRGIYNSSEAASIKITRAVA